mmetsp:Transcript_17326/g.37384  ORF Transcript_17326/g.37384 Transcript_17326/m.37384 type:complete len:127 (-) Transcript_17326:208-588(-)
MRSILKSNCSLDSESIDTPYWSSLMIFVAVDREGITSPSAVFVSSSWTYHRVTFDCLYLSSADVVVVVAYLGDTHATAKKFAQSIVVTDDVYTSDIKLRLMWQRKRSIETTKPLNAEKEAIWYVRP